MQKILIVEDDGDIAAIERDYLELNNYQGGKRVVSLCFYAMQDILHIYVWYRMNHF